MVRDLSGQMAHDAFDARRPGDGIVLVQDARQFLFQEQLSEHLHQTNNASDRHVACAI